MANRRRKSRSSDRFIFSDSKITADSDCSHEIKRHLLLGRKGMTNLNSMLKSSDITLPTKVHTVKAMVFPVVMYKYESWTIKKTEHWRIGCFWTVMLEKTLESPLDGKEIKPVNPKEHQPWIFIEGLILKLQYFAYLIWRVDSLGKKQVFQHEVWFVVVVQSLSRVQLFATHILQHARLPCPSLSPGVCSNSCLLSR